MSHPIFHLELTVHRCLAEVRLNDFPVAQIESAAQPAWFAPPVNPWLVGEDNVIEVTLHSFEGSTFSDARIEGHLRAYEKGDICAPGEGPEPLFSFGVPDELVERVREEELELPQSFTVRFSNPTVDFSDELRAPPAFDDPQALYDYGERLRDLVRQRDVERLVEEFSFKAASWMRAFDEPEQGFAQMLREELAEFFAEQPETDFERTDLELAPACGGRLWEIRRTGDVPLLTSTPDADGGQSHWRIWAAPRDGVLRVVR